jgi:hypothetical protein
MVIQQVRSGRRVADVAARVEVPEATVFRWVLFLTWCGVDALKLATIRNPSICYLTDGGVDTGRKRVVGWLLLHGRVTGVNSGPVGVVLSSKTTRITRKVVAAR